jgi:hypothetical protein
VTVPAGVVGLGELVSVTVAVHVEAWLTTTGVLQDTLVNVEALVEGFTVMSKKAELDVWKLSVWTVAVIL